MGKCWVIFQQGNELEFFLEHVLFLSEPPETSTVLSTQELPCCCVFNCFYHSTEYSSFVWLFWRWNTLVFLCFFGVERDLAWRPVLLPTLEKIKVNNSWQGVSQKLWFLENLKTFCRKFYWGSRKIGFSYFYLFYLCRVFVVTLDNIHSPFLQQQSWFLFEHPSPSRPPPMCFLWDPISRSKTTTMWQFFWPPWWVQRRSPT